MRLPQSILRSFFVRTIHFLSIARVLLLLGMVPVTISAANAQLVFTPTELRFGSVVVGQTETLAATIANTGQASVTITAVAVSNAEFATSGLTLPLALAAGQSVELSVSFTPTSTRYAGGTIKLISNVRNAVLQVAGSGENFQAVVANPSGVSFGQVMVGSTSTVSVVVSNTLSHKVMLSSLQSTGAGFSVSGPPFPMTLNAGQSITLKTAFAPQSAGASGGSLFISGPGLAIPLSGTGEMAGQLTANPASLAFGSVQDGANLTLTDSLTNTGASSVTISQASVTGAAFSMSGLNPPLTLNPGASVTFTVVFAPQSPGGVNGNILVSSNAADSSLNVSLSGTGSAQGQLAITPPSENFGNVNVGSSASQTSSISASGASVAISSASLNNSEFSLSGLSFPLTLAAGQSVAAILTFAPQSSGTANAVLTVASNAANSPSEALSGNGVAASHSVSLSWSDSGSGIAGYNVFRGGNSGGPYAQINPSLDTAPAYTDNSVAAGQTYYYVVTAISGNGMQSAYSSPTEAQIPNN
jgi:Cep192 domain 4/HYDIN/CFA65/VesB-like, Ig-like domain/Abnormal spindle-like microcephaly-assoc'd, ASPM-SPD-2-Hydin